MQSPHSTSSEKSQILSLALALVLLISSVSPTSSCTEKEKGSLLQFLEGISQDGGLAGSWHGGTDCCTWEGITCSTYGHRPFIIGVSLASRSLEGKISPSLGNLIGLRLLNLSHNSLSGEIPDSIGQLKSLQVLDFSNNHLTCGIPAILNNLHFLYAFNISNNDLEGPIPSGGQFNTFLNSSYNGNPKLFGPMLTRKCVSGSSPLVSGKQRNKKAIFAISFGIFFGGVVTLVLLGVLVSIRLKGSRTENTRGGEGDIEATSDDSNPEFVQVKKKYPELVIMRVPQGNGEANNLRFNDILDATNNFDEETIIGSGGYGSVYKAELPDGSKLAIKRLNSMYLMEREFAAEIDALTLAQHENLVSLWGHCIWGNSRFIIYAYMEKGSLYDWLHNKGDDATRFLDWPMRLKIAQGASQGLRYIHETCTPRIIHRDIKSSNILLDEEFNAYVGDFGIARLIDPNSSHVSTERQGTNYYMAPEYKLTNNATFKGDIYSFGVVLLELLTGRQPMFQDLPTKAKLLVPWVRQMRSRGKQIEVLDPTLRGRGHEEQMLKMLEVASKCVHSWADSRPTMTEVVRLLGTIGADL